MSVYYNPKSNNLYTLPYVNDGYGMYCERNILTMLEYIGEL